MKAKTNNKNKENKENTEGLKKIKNITGIHMNIRNVMKNIEQFKIYLNSINENIDFIVMTETWVNERQALNYGVKIDGYNLEWSTEKYNKNGGVGIAINKNWEYNRIEETKEGIEADEVTIRLKGTCKKNSLIIQAIYRNPNRDPSIFINKISRKLMKFRKKEDNVIAIGDWNVNLLKKTPISENLNDEMKEIGYNQIIKEATRETETTKSLIDLCYTNIEQEIITGSVIHKAITDHYITKIVMRKHDTNEQRKKKISEDRINNGK